MFERLILGSANFGMDYGISCGRRLSNEEVFQILDRAWQEGIRWIDTAQAYGGSEEVIGNYMRQKGRIFNIITKLPHGNYGNYKDIKEKVLESKKKLQVEKIKVLLLHSFKTFDDKRELMSESLERLKEEGLIEEYGVSVYHVEEVFDFFHVIKKPFVVEFPANVFDRRFIRRLKELKELKLKLLARSVFLQGLFFLPEERLTGFFAPIRDKVLSLKKKAELLNLPLSCLCLIFVWQYSDIEGIILGVDNLRQLEENLECIRSNISFSEVLEGFEVEDENIILPYNWR